MSVQRSARNAPGHIQPPDLRPRVLSIPENADILRSLARSTGLTVALEDVSPSPNGHGPSCCRMTSLGPRRISECVERRADLAKKVAGNGTSAAIHCPVGTFCLATPVFWRGIHIATLRAGGFTKKMGASKERADAVRKLLELAADELGRRADHLTTHPGSDSAAVRRVMEHIQSHSNEPIRVRDLAAVAGVSRQHLAKIWKKQVGVPLNVCLSTVRVERAKVLLAAGNKKIVDVAMECGFGSLSQFNRSFLRATGVSPRSWLTQSR